MSLAGYHSKRDFQKTPEPKGAVKKGKGKRLAFVVQEHHASQLHYDFRLELDGVLKSWAVPKGPSMNPHDHHLAIMTEDHPFEYRTFEGVIPEGHYGAGNVIIWDEGWYEPYHDDPNIEKVLRAELKKGHLTFFLHGKKLHGEFALIKMHADDPKAWLLIKKGDEAASAKDITKQDQSVKSGKKVDEIGDKPSLDRAPKVAKPWHVKPMLATLVDNIFDKDDWLFEIKWDGFRAVASKHKDDIDLYSRNDTDFRMHYPPVLEAVKDLKHDVILDGEIVVVDDDGHSHFEWLQGWRTAPTGHLRYYVFDILWCDGRDVRDQPLIERKKLLESVVPKSDVIFYSDHIEKHGTALFHEMQKQGMEGVIAKDASSPYREGIRGQEWLKIKTHLRQEVVIGGYTEPRGGRKYLGALVVGVYEKGELQYIGHSGGGIPDNLRKKLQEKLARLERQSSPFKTEPKPNAPVHWVRPELVCEMSFSEWTDDGSMRHPSFEGLRADKSPRNVHREKSKNAAPAAAKKEPSMPADKPEFTHLDKVFFPKGKITKGDMLDYYRSVADYMLPYLKDRPHSLNRHPNGIKGESFYQKNMEHLPKWVPSVDIYSESNEENLHWLVGGDLNTLLYMVQLGCIEINPWNSRVKHLKRPDWAIIDLDPEGARTFKDVVQVARTVKAVCDEWKVPSYPKTSGKTGIHIFIPMGAKYTYEQVKNFAHLMAIEVNKREPKLTSVERMPDKRKNKIYVDFLQNREGQTLAAPYSLRPTPDATVSMPLHWDEVTPSLKPTDFTIKNALTRLKKTGDLWEPVLGKGVDLKTILKRMDTSAKN
jgi:bifunctional non-homologous end joining protein LigD